MKVLVQGNKIVELAKSDYQSLTHEQLTVKNCNVKLTQKIPEGHNYYVIIYSLVDNCRINR